jgi:hypothetical protein
MAKVSCGRSKAARRADRGSYLLGDTPQRNVVGNLFDQQFTAEMIVKTFTDIFSKAASRKRIRFTTEIVEIKAIVTATGGEIRQQTI